jgi:glycosyltransferase involved in cell wall biosynthesis
MASGQTSLSTSRSRELPGVSVHAALAAIDDLELQTLDLGRPIGRHHGLARIRPVLDNLRGMSSLVRLALWCRSNGVDIVHVTERPRQALFGLLVARLAGAACLIQAHTVYYPRDATRFSNWRLHQADAVVGVSNFVARSFQRHGQLPEDRVFAVHNAVDANVFCPEVAAMGRDEMRQQLGLPHDAVVIGCVARLMAWKGQDVLLQAFTRVRGQIPRAHLVLAGTSAESAPDGRGDYRDYLLRQVSNLGLDGYVHLPGFLLQTAMPRFYGALDLVAHPSIEEPFGLAVVEAMASGRPVVAVNRGGIPEIIRDGLDGVLVPAQEPTALASAIVHLIHQPQLAAQLSGAGRRRVVEVFTPEAQAERMARIYETVAIRRAH